MALEIPILSIPVDDKGKPAAWWCLPYWHNGVADWIKDYSTRLNTDCPNNDDCSVDPDTLRAQTEAVLQQMTVWGANKPLSLDVYTIARNIASEFDNGNPEEQAAIAFAAINRAKYD